MQTRPRFLRVLGTVAAVVVAGLIGAVVSPGGGGRTIAAVDPGRLGAGGEYHPIDPTRIVDSRVGLGLSGPLATGPVGSDLLLDAAVLGQGGLPEFVSTDGDDFDDQVLAVVLNFTVIEPSRSGYLRAFGAGARENETSVANFGPGDVVANTAILRPGADGRISLRFVTNGGAGSVQLAVDVLGWFSTSGYQEYGARTISVEPTRLFDSRESEFGARPFGPADTREVVIRGARALGGSGVPVPDDPSVTGVIVNVTGVNDRPASKLTFVSLLDDPPVGPVRTSNLNLAKGQIRANLSIVPLPQDGVLTIYNHSGETDVVIDVVGYLRAGADPATRAGRVVPLEAPFRALDTREAEHFNVRLGPSRSEDWSFDSFSADVRIGGDWVGPQSGFFGNLTGAELVSSTSSSGVRTFLTAYPSPAQRAGGPPLVSNLNLVGGVAVPNLALLRYGSATVDGTDIDHGIALFNKNGYVHYLVDVYAVVLAEAD